MMVVDDGVAVLEDWPKGGMAVLEAVSSSSSSRCVFGQSKDDNPLGGMLVQEDSHCGDPGRQLYSLLISWPYPS